MKRKLISLVSMILIMASMSVNAYALSPVRINRPITTITKAEAADMLVDRLNLTVPAINYFNDLGKVEHRDAILIAAAAGLFKEKDNIKAEDKLTYQEALVMISSALQIDPDYQIKNRYCNADKWAWPYIAPLIDVLPVEYVKFDMKNHITGVQLVDLIHKIAFEPDAGEKYMNLNLHNVLLTSEDVGFAFTTIENLYVIPGVNPENLTLYKTNIKNIINIGDKIDTHEDAAFDVLLSEFSTKFDPGQINRSINLKLSMKGVNGTILKPGDEFSYNGILGERTYEKGYRNATIISGGKYVQGMAGGICQTSTTIFNAALEAGLDITERSSHSLKSSYVKVGRDAAVSYGVLDLKFKNNYDIPIKIEGIYNNNGTLTTKIWSQGYIYIPEIEIEVKGGPNSYTTYRYSDGVKDYTAKSWYKG